MIILGMGLRSYELYHPNETEPSGFIVFFTLACIFGFPMLYPIYDALDVSKNILLFRSLKIKYPNLSKIKIKHPKFNAIWKLSLLFGWTYIGALLILIWSHLSREVELPHEYAEAIKKYNDPRRIEREVFRSLRAESINKDKDARAEREEGRSAVGYHLKSDPAQATVPVPVVVAPVVAASVEALPKKPVVRECYSCGAQLENELVCRYCGTSFKLWPS